MAEPKVGGRVRLTAPMLNPNSSWMPKEEGMPVGLEGTITYVEMSGPPNLRQIGVRWDNGRSLGLIPAVDHFEILTTESANDTCSEAGVGRRNREGESVGS